MAYTTPVFNVPVDVWVTGSLPDDDVPDFEGVTCQFYIYSRGSFDVQPCELELYTPPIQLRMPLDTLLIWATGQIFEVPAESGRYYRARFKDRLHLGFPNEYLVVWLIQCNGAGLAIIRDVEGSIPCDPVPSVGGVGDDEVIIDIDGEGAGTLGGGGGSHEGSGEWVFHITGTADGEGSSFP